MNTIHKHTFTCYMSASCFACTQMALVGQEPALFSCSIRDNITYGLDECSEADVISAARQANAHDFICAMRNGYDTLAGEKGLLVSGIFPGFAF